MNKYKWSGPNKTIGKFEYEGQKFDRVEIRKKFKGKPDGRYVLESQTVIVAALVRNNVIEEFRLLN